MSDIFFIGARQSDAGLTPALVGGKAANLARLDRLGLRVPPALAIATSVARDYGAHGTLAPEFRTRLAGCVRQLEAATGQALGGREPLLLSVRSSPPASMPGILETVVNIGLTEPGVHGLIRRTGNPWLAWDAYRRLLRSFAETVFAADTRPLDALERDYCAAHGAASLQDLDPLELRDLTHEAAAWLHARGIDLPRDPIEQVTAAVEAVLRSWTTPRASTYRRMNGIPDDTGTGALVQAMVFGNAGARSGSGVGFTRSPATGSADLFVDFAFNAQGEDVVSGRVPLVDTSQLSDIMPTVYADLVAARSALEREFLDMQDFEFTVENGDLYFLQSRAGKRTAWAALQIAVDLVREGLISSDTALGRLRPYDLDRVERTTTEHPDESARVAMGVPAGLGVASGGIVFDATRAQRLAEQAPVLLVRPDLVTEDLAGIAAAAGVLTAVGGRTAHAAVVARQLGKPCVVGCPGLVIDESARTCTIGGRRLHEGDVVTIDGETGAVYLGVVGVMRERPIDALAAVSRWSRGSR